MTAVAAAYLFATAASAQSADDVLTYRGPDREQKLIEGAKKEGEVVFYSGMIANQALRPATESFQKKYPFIRMTRPSLPPSPNDCATRVRCGRRPA